MSDFLQRLRERKLVQWALAYGAAAFAMIQVTDVVAQQFGWPDGARRGITIMLAIAMLVADELLSNAVHNARLEPSC